MVKLKWRTWVSSLQFDYPFTKRWQGKHKRDYAEWYRRLPVGAVEALRQIEAENPYSDYREPVDHDSRLFARFHEQWAIAHNASIDTLASEQSASWRETRIEGIRHVQAVRKLDRAIAKYHRRTASPVETPVSTLASHPLPAINLQGEDTTESEILELLATIRDDDRRADVRAECWIVRSTHPSAPAKHVFNRALKTCQMVSRGVYSEKERKRIERKGIPSNAVGEPMHSKAVQYWQDTCEQLNKAEREQLAVVIARSSLGQEILQKHIAGKTYAQIAQEMGTTERTIYRRFAALENKPSVEWSMERNSVFVRTD